MIGKARIARDISYAHSAASRSGRAFIRAMENATGRLSLIKRASGYEHEVAQGRDFWQVMVERYGLELDVVGGSLANIPATGPLILVSNHPYGILDGLMMGHILSQQRGDFRILAHRVFRKAADLEKVILPISFDESKEAVALNLATRKEALTYLGQGGAIGIFPGGTVSTAATPLAHPLDPGWRSFTARMVAKSGATVVPMFFDGHTSRLLIREFRARVNTPVRIVVGDPIPPAEIAARANDAKAMMDFLRKQTYDLSPTPLPAGYGFEFEQKHRAKPRA